MKKKGIHNKVITTAILIGLVFMNKTQVAFCSETKIYNLDELQKYVYEQMINRQEHITFTYKGDKKEFVNNISNTIKKAYQEDTYTERVWVNIDPKATINKNGIETDIKVSYLTSKQQEEYIDSEVNKIITTIIKPNMTEEDKIKAVNDYLINRFEYDYTYTSNNPYAALTTNKTVCQGYSMTAYKLLNKLNIDCRIVVGAIGDIGHSWNEVKINNEWKYLDITSNDTKKYNRYFLVDKSELIKDGYVWSEENQ